MVIFFHCLLSFTCQVPDSHFISFSQIFPRHWKLCSVRVWQLKGYILSFTDFQWLEIMCVIVARLIMEEVEKHPVTRSVIVSKRLLGLKEFQIIPVLMMLSYDFGFVSFSNFTTQTQPAALYCLNPAIGQRVLICRWKSTQGRKVPLIFSSWTCLGFHHCVKGFCL